MITTTVLSLTCIVLAGIAVCLWFYYMGLKHDFDDALQDVDYYYKMAGRYRSKAIDSDQEIKELRRLLEDHEQS